MKLLFAILFILPVSCFADMVGCHPTYHISFKIDNADKFPDYTFCFSRWHSDSTVYVPGQDFKYTTQHDWDVTLFANNKKTGGSTSHANVQGMNNQTIVITIEKIENDSIYFKTRSEEAKTSDPANNSITPLAKTMLFISFCGLFLYCCSILLRKKSLNNI